MCAYNRVNDDWACEQRHLLTDILKGDWAFPGAVVSDWQSTHQTVQEIAVAVVERRTRFAPRLD